ETEAPFWSALLVQPIRISYRERRDFRRFQTEREMSAVGTKRTFALPDLTSAFDPKRTSGAVGTSESGRPQTAKRNLSTVHDPHHGSQCRGWVWPRYQMTISERPQRARRSTCRLPR